MKLKLIFVIALIQCAALGVLGAPKPMFTMEYKTLPFGKSEPDIINWLEQQSNVVVYEDRSVNINAFLCFQAIMPYFAAGVRKTESQGPQFYNYFIKKYVVERCYDIFPNTFRADFYFVRDDKDRYTLFMVHRVCRVESGAMKDIYATELAERTKEYGEPNRTWESTSTGSNKTSSDRLLPANVTLWQKDKGSIFFMMADNGMLQFKEFLFVSSEGWNIYLKSLEKARAWR